MTILLRDIRLYLTVLLDSRCPLFVGDIVIFLVFSGTLSSVFQVFITIGIFYVNTIGAMRQYLMLNLLCGVWTIIHAIGTFFIIESPYYLLNKNDDEKAASVLKKLRSTGTDTAQELVALKVYNIFTIFVYFYDMFLI